MSVISLTITRSETETVSGIPDTITVSTNIPAIIFYTLDGTEPTAYSSVYTSPIRLPNYLPTITLTTLASDGSSISSIFSQTFTADLSSITNLTSTGAKFPQATSQPINAPNNGNSLYPFGTTNQSSQTKYNGIGNPDNTLLNEALPSSPNAFDSSGNPTSFTNQPLNLFGYPPKPEDKNVRVIGKNSPTEFVQEFSSNNDKLFNPKALVIYHDASNTDPLTPVIINRPHFSLENPESTKDGILLSTVGLESPTLTGSFVHRGYNPNTGKMTNYYRDSSTNRWIISTYDYSPSTPNSGSLSNIVFGREAGSRYVYPWVLWQKRTLG